MFSEERVAKEELSFFLLIDSKSTLLPLNLLPFTEPALLPLNLPPFIEP